MKKQNIEDIFSSIENFSSVPPPELWDNIEEQLDKPKKKKRAIVWWSAAACLLLGLSIPSGLYFNSRSGKSIPNDGGVENNTVVFDKKGVQKNSETVVSKEQNNNIQPEKTVGISTIQHKSERTNTLSTKQNKAIVAEANANGLNSKTSDKKTSTKEKIQNENLSNGFSNDQNSKLNNENTISNNSNAVASNSSNQNKTIEKEAVANQNLIAKNKNAVASNSSIQNKTNKKEAVANENLISKSKNAVASNSSNQNKINTDHSGEKNAVINNDKAVSFNQNSNSSILLSKKDSIQLAELNSLEDAIKNPKKEKEEIINPITKAEKWSVEVFAGVANSENYKNDKTLGNVNSSKQSNTYGVKTNYKLNKKWAVSSGLKINELGQSIANVSYIDNRSIAYMSSGFSADRAPSSSQITNNPDYVFVAVPNSKAQNAVSNGIVNTASFESGNVDQRLKYLEMPFEVSYFLLNKNKTSVSLNTGGFVGKLISNDVYLNGTAIGDNQNANDFVYGSLLSSTLQYRLYKKTNVFVEPGMNYYANPLNNQSFNQFQWSFNFGLNVSF